MATRVAWGGVVGNPNPNPFLKCVQIHPKYTPNTPQIHPKYTPNTLPCGPGTALQPPERGERVSREGALLTIPLLIMMTITVVMVAVVVVAVAVGAAATTRRQHSTPVLRAGPWFGGGGGMCHETRGAGQGGACAQRGRGRCTAPLVGWVFQ